MRRAYEREDELEEMQSIARVPIRAVPDGEIVRVVGRVESSEPLLVAPFSGRPCVFYEVELVRRHRDLIGLLEGRIFSHGEGCAFEVEEDGARAFVDGYWDAYIADRVAQEGSADDIPSQAQQWLRENHATDRDWRDEKHLFWTEQRIEPGDRVAVVGLAHLQVDWAGGAGGGGYRDAPMRVVFEDAEGAPVSVSDHPSLIGD